MLGHNRRMATYEQGGTSLDIKSAGTLTLDFLASSIVRNKFLLLVNHPVDGICYNILDRLRQKPRSECNKYTGVSLLRNECKKIYVCTLSHVHKHFCISVATCVYSKWWWMHAGSSDFNPALKASPSLLSLIILSFFQWHWEVWLLSSAICLLIYWNIHTVSDLLTLPLWETDSSECICSMFCL